jgi:DNA mismatch repair protein MutS
MDAATRRNLEITQNLAGGFDNTLASVLDCTVTPMGSRMLKRWLHMPVRHGGAGRTSANQARCRSVIPNCSRCCVRWAIWNVFWRDWRCAPRVRATSPACVMRSSSCRILREMLADVSCAPVQKLRDKMGEFSELRELLERAIIDAPPVLVRDGGVIARATMRSSMSGARWRMAHDYLDKLEIRERERLGLDTLKVGYNAVHGYYIQISRGQSHHAPIHYVRRQTLKNAERYIIPELKEYEDKY